MMLRDYEPYRHLLEKFSQDDNSMSLREHLYRPGQPTLSQEQIDALWAKFGFVMPRDGGHTTKRRPGDLVKLAVFCFGGMLLCLTFKVWRRRQG